MSDFFNHRHLKIRRSYIHRIKPGKEIPKHVDDNDQPYFLVCKRYQLFINIPNNVIIESVPKAKENTFFWFDHNKFHYYKNNSNEDLIFCVVDTTPR
jgi:aspartyl/asparaginyl beta-hydroxylase (cupin superfamily)